MKLNNYHTLQTILSINLMFAHIELGPEHFPVMAFDKRRPLFHKLGPIRVGLLRVHHAAWEALHHKVAEFRGQPRHERRRVVSRGEKRLSCPLGLLGRHIRSRSDLYGWIDEENGENLAVAGFAWLNQTERGDTVLVDVRPDQQTPVFGILFFISEQ